MTTAEPVEGDIARLHAAFHSGTQTPADAWAAIRARIREHDRTIGAIVAFDEERAGAAADAASERWARGAARSPLDGIPIGVKANIAVAGLPWTAGIGAYRNRIAERDADCVARLRAAGAVVIGTLNMDEGALGATCDNPWFGRTRNPGPVGDEPYCAGGSSGGSAAAVAAGFCVAALGTDTMGSVRIPASYCGVVGYCPEADRIARDGVVALAPTFDRVGVIARSVEDCVVVADIAGHGAREADLASDPTIVALDLDGHDVSAEVRDAFEMLLERVAAGGQRVARTRLPAYDAREAERRLLLLVEAEGFSVHAALLARADANVSMPLRRLLAFGGSQTFAKLDAARDTLATAHRAVREALAGHAALLTPTTPTTSFAFSGTAPDHPARFTTIGTVARLPALALRLPGTKPGLRASVQILAHDDATLLRIGERLQRLVGALDR